MKQYQITADPALRNSLKDNRFQQSFLSYTLVDNRIVVRENDAFKQELEQKISQHFIFMLRASFFSGVFEEITIFIEKYSNQFQSSVKLFSQWKMVEEMIGITETNLQWAKDQITLIEEYKRSGVTHEEYNVDQKHIWLAMLDKDFMRVGAMDNAMKEGERARVEAEAFTTKTEAEFHLAWLVEQQQRQQEFQIQLDQIGENWNSDYETYNKGKDFVEKVKNSQNDLFNNKSWNTSDLGQELQAQREIANPYFNNLYQQYLACFKFQLDLEELYELVINKKQIKEIIIEIAQREAQKPTVMAFIKYWSSELRDADHKLQNLANNDKITKLMEFALNAHISLLALERGYRGLHLEVSRQQEYIVQQNGARTNNGVYVSSVSLEKPDIQLIHIDPSRIQYTQETLEQFEIVRQYERNLWLWQEEITKLQNCHLKLQELQAQPPLIREKYAQAYQNESLGGENLVSQFKELLALSLLEDYNELYYKKERIMCLVGALSERLVIKRNTSCMCCSTQKMHQTDNMFYENYEKSIAAEVRRLTNAENKWFTSASQRIQSVDKLPAVKTTSYLMSNNHILASLRNNSGQRQVSNGIRNFDANESIVMTINELCQLIVVEEKIRLNMQSPNIDAKIQRWQRLQKEATEGKRAQNHVNVELA